MMSERLTKHEEYLCEIMQELNLWDDYQAKKKKAMERASASAELNIEQIVKEVL